MKKRFEVLDSFRGISAIFVVLFHMNYVGSITELSFLKAVSFLLNSFLS